MNTILSIEEDNPNSIGSIHNITTEIQEIRIRRDQSLLSQYKEIAHRTVLPRVEPCWQCSKRLSACDEEGKGKYTKGKYRGPVIAFVVEILGFPRKLHGVCAESLGYKLESTADLRGQERL